MALTEEIICILAEKISRVYASSLTELVLKRLDRFGYKVIEADVFAIAYSLQKIENVIKNSCNVSELPDGLTHYAVDMVCGDFLDVIYRTGQLNLEDLDLKGAIASVSAGDTSVSFDNETSDDGKFNALLQSLQNNGRSEFACYRKLSW